MKNENLEKYIRELSPEMQEKARACKDMQELNDLLAENDVELSEDALEAVAGGCKTTVNYCYVCDPVTECTKAICPLCHQQLYYWDMCYNEKGFRYITRMYCNNSSCSSYNNGLWYVKAYDSGVIAINTKIEKY